MKNNNKNLLLLILFSIGFSIISIVSIVGNSNNFISITSNEFCSAQGDLRPTPFENVIVDKINKSKDVEFFCSLEYICPAPFDKEKDDIKSGS